MNERIHVFTIGFTRKTAAEFFGLLERAGVKRVVDVRLNNVSQLAGFAKKDDLAFFLKRVGWMEYVHVPILAPTQAILDRLKKEKGTWEEYERAFVGVMKERQIETKVPRELVDMGCLLCSEDVPAHCHRRLVAEYLQQAWGGAEAVEVTHLV
jgi:uncharacterized protein (DUF488 family)